ncbi:MAG: PKD domain-containing protein, partial [Actinomycetes bacterium]
SVFEKGIITITGYNYVDANLPQVRVLNSAGQTIDAMHPQAHRSSNYQLQINLQDVDFSLVPALSRVELKWPNVPDTSSLAILIPDRLPELAIKDSSVTVYEGSGVVYRSLGIASQGAVYTVNGRTGDSSWWQIDYSGKPGWVPTASVSRKDNLPVSVALTIPLRPPVASFTASTHSGSAPLTVRFTDTSEGNPTTWRWELGDGQTSTSGNPVCDYTKAGTYTVRLTVANSACPNTATALITVNPPGPKADFSALPPSGDAPLKVTFQDRSTNIPTSWRWEFGDNTNSTQQHPQHTYATAGTYTVKLTVTNAQGSDSKLGNNPISVTPTPLKALFTGQPPLSGKVPLTVRFTDQSEGNPTGWLWDFGDSATTTTRNPVHEYRKPGTFTVKLTVSNSQGANTKTAPGYVVLRPLPACTYTIWVSEEGGGPAAECTVGYAARGLQCRGDNCDDVSLYCCPYIEGADNTARTRWSGWFSEEQPRQFDDTAWVNALRCRGDDCDDMNMRFMTSDYLRHTPLCNWMKSVSEEQREGAKCESNWFVSGMKCGGDDCDNISLYCCQAE